MHQLSCVSFLISPTLSHHHAVPQQLALNIWRLPSISASPNPDSTPTVTVPSNSTASCHHGAQQHPWFSTWEYRLMTINPKGALGGILEEPSHTVPCLVVLHRPVVCAPFYLDNVLPKANKSLLKHNKKATNSCNDKRLNHFWGFMALGISIYQRHYQRKKISLCWRPSFHSKTVSMERFQPVLITTIWLRTSQCPALTMGVPAGSPAGLMPLLCRQSP